MLQALAVSSLHRRRAESELRWDGSGAGKGRIQSHGGCYPFSLTRITLSADRGARPSESLGPPAPYALAFLAPPAQMPVVLPVHRGDQKTLPSRHSRGKTTAPHSEVHASLPRCPLITASQYKALLIVCVHPAFCPD